MLPPTMTPSTRALDPGLASSVSHFWDMRKHQAKRQGQGGAKDQGARAAVTGGAQMDGFIRLVTKLVVDSGISKHCIHYESRLELPGFFRPTKKWDVLVVKDGQLLAALEAKSQVGPSFGNNYNNRIEEAVGTATDLKTAFREGALNRSSAPWMGYLFLLEDCPKSRSPVEVSEPHFKVFQEFRQASYAKRYELFCRKLVREGHYTAAAFLLSNARDGLQGIYEQPAPDIAFEPLARSLSAHLGAYTNEGR